MVLNAVKRCLKLTPMQLSHSVYYNIYIIFLFLKKIINLKWI